MFQGKQPSPSTPSFQRKILGAHVTRSLIFHVPEYDSCHGTSRRKQASYAIKLLCSGAQLGHTNLS